MQVEQGPQVVTEEFGGPAGEPRYEGPRKDDDTVYIGKKPLMAYVLAVVTQFNSGSNEVKLKARGKAICRAVDVTQVVKNRFLPMLQITDFKAETEELPSEDGRMNKVSSLTLTLKK